MAISKSVFESHEERVAAITKIAVERKASCLTRARTN